MSEINVVQLPLIDKGQEVTHMREIKRIIIHCSDSEFGDWRLIDRWHRERGFNQIGYHFVILNGWTTDKGHYQPRADGVCQMGRTLDQIGAHCKGHNNDSIGICLIGKRLFSGKQLLEGLPSLLRSLCEQFVLGPKDVFGHYEFNKSKTCPNLDMEMIRTLLI